MLPQLLQSTTIPALTEVVKFAQARHEVLAGNIANANTPGYRTRDLSLPVFQQRLKEMIDVQRAGGRAANPSPGHISPDPSDALRTVQEVTKNILQHDDTNIDLEKQAAEMAKNQALHSMALTIMNNQMQLMQVAISERI